MRPRSSEWSSGPMTMRVTLPSQASQRARAAEIAAPKPSAGRARGWSAGSTRSASAIVTIDVRLDRPQDRQPGRRRGRRRHNCTRASPSCWARVRVSPAGRSACTKDSRAAWTFSPPTGVELEPPQDTLPSAVLGQSSATGPRWGRVRCRRGRGGTGRGAPPGPAARAAGWWRSRPAPRRSRPGRRPARRRRPGSRRGDRGEHRHLLGGDQPRRRTPRRRPGRCSRVRPLRTSWRAAAGREPQVPAQPGGHRLQPVVLRRPARRSAPRTARASRAAIRFARPHQHRRSGRAAGRGRQGVEVVGGERVQGRQQLAHDTSHAFDQVFEVYRLKSPCTR